VIPTTIHGLVETRSQLSTMLRVFRRDARGAFAFGRHHQAEAVILPWRLFEQLAAAAEGLDDAARAVDLDRRRRHPAGPAPLALSALADALQVPAAALKRAGRKISVWPGAVDDLLQLGDEQPLDAREQVAAALTDLATLVRLGAPLVSLPGQPQLDDYRRLVAPLGAQRPTLHITFRAAGAQAGIELLAITSAGRLVAALQELDTHLDLTGPAATELDDCEEPTP
jgi:hypothetical protein